MIRLFVEVVPDAGTLEIFGREAHYLSRVRRAAPGARLELLEGSGRRALAVLESLGRDRAVIRVLESFPAASGTSSIHLMVAVPRRNLMDRVIRGAGELGAARITPVIAKRAVMVPGDGRFERWRRIADEAMRQCGRRSPLKLDPPVPLLDAFDLADTESIRLLMHPRPDVPQMIRVLSPDARPSSSNRPVTIAVGPEGGFEEDEVESARARGFSPIRLGDCVLRVETAAVAAVAVAAALAASGRPGGGP